MVSPTRRTRYAHLPPDFVHPLPTQPEATLTLKTVLIAVAAAVALLGAALIGVPSAQDGLQLCLSLPRCLGF